MDEDYYLSGGSEDDGDCLLSDQEVESLDGLDVEETGAQSATSEAPSAQVVYTYGYRFL